MQHRDALALLNRRMRHARRVLIAERWLAALLPVILAVAVWAGVVMAGLTSAGGPILRSALHACGFLLTLWAIARAVRLRQRTGEADARRRVAETAGVTPGAYQALDDQPAKLDPAALALWRAEQDRASARVAAAPWAKFRPNIATTDRLRLRYVAAPAVLAGALLGGAQAPQRLADAVFPDPGPLLGDRPVAVEAWLTPADYTGAAPIALSDRLGARVETPPSVSVTVRATGPRGAPLLVYESNEGRQAMRFARAADGAYEARMTLNGRGRLRVVRYWHDKASWRIAPAPDNAPRVAFRAAPNVLPGERVSLAWSAEDDFGVRRMVLRVRPIDPPRGVRRDPDIDTALDAVRGDPRRSDDRQALELARHPYAGMEVEARLVAIDALGQEGQSAPVRLRMPEKLFVQPLARAAIEIRREILLERRPYRGEYHQRAQSVRTPAADGSAPPAFFRLVRPRGDARLSRAPDGVHRALDLIGIVTQQPEDGYFRDLAVYLGFQHARAALESARNSTETGRAAEALWRTAWRAEYGGAVDARRALELAQEDLSQSMDEAGADRTEAVQRAVEALREATQAYLQSLVAEAARRGDQRAQDDAVEQTEVTENDIDSLLAQVERLAQEGRVEEAERMLQDLTQMLANLDVRLEETPPPQESAEQDQPPPPEEEDQQNAENESGAEQQAEQQAQESMEALNETMDAQRALRDETRRQQDQPPEGGAEQGQEGGAGGGSENGEGLAEMQSAVRDQLQAARSIGAEAGAEGSESLSQAEQAMRRAENALQRGDFAEASRAQNEAMRRLRSGADQLASSLQAGANAQRAPGEGDRGGGPRDPLGRQVLGSGDDGSTRVPTAAERGRAQEIVEEIRRRARDARRSEAERAYLRRLLERFENE